MSSCCARSSACAHAHGEVNTKARHAPRKGSAGLGRPRPASAPAFARGFARARARLRGHRLHEAGGVRDLLQERLAERRRGAKVARCRREHLLGLRVEGRPLHFAVHEDEHLGLRRQAKQRNAKQSRQAVSANATNAGFCRFRAAELLSRRPRPHRSHRLWRRARHGTARALTRPPLRFARAGGRALTWAALMCWAMSLCLRLIACAGSIAGGGREQRPGLTLAPRAWRLACSRHARLARPAAPHSTKKSPRMALPSPSPPLPRTASTRLGGRRAVTTCRATASATAWGTGAGAQRCGRTPRETRRGARGRRAAAEGRA